MTQVSPVNIVNSTLNVATINNDQKASIKTHNLSSFISGNPQREFLLNPPPVTDTLLVVLDGLILQPEQDGSTGDYSLSGATITLSQDLIFETNTVLLAIYQEV
jgi:hypothetical protein